MPGLAYYQQIFAPKNNTSLAHTILISGPYGGGQSILADTLLDRCLTPDQRYKQEDQMILDLPEGKTRISLEQVHTMREFLSRSPLFGSYKAAVVYHADFLTVEAQNALLKSIEEPSESSIIILVSSYGQLLPTIVSRAQHIEVQAVQPVAPDEYDRWALYHAGLAHRLRTDSKFRGWYQEMERTVLALRDSSLATRTNTIAERLKATSRIAEDDLLVWYITWRHVLYEILGRPVHPYRRMQTMWNTSIPSPSEAVQVLEELQKVRTYAFFTHTRADLAWERMAFNLP